MPAVKKVVYEKGFGKAIVTNEPSSHDNDPFFLEKLEKAKKVLSNVKFPEEIKK